MLAAAPMAYLGRMNAVVNFDALPGGALVAAGLADLARKRESAAALLVSVGAERMREAGLEVPESFGDPERRLYELLAREDADAAHGRYNAFIRLLVSFERALECAK
jgi:hypothetical protein